MLQLYVTLIPPWCGLCSEADSRLTVAARAVLRRDLVGNNFPVRAARQHPARRWGASACCDT